MKNNSYVKLIFGIVLVVAGAVLSVGVDRWTQLLELEHLLGVILAVGAAFNLSGSPSHVRSKNGNGGGD